MCAVVMGIGERGTGKGQVWGLGGGRAVPFAPFASNGHVARGDAAAAAAGGAPRKPPAVGLSLLGGGGVGTALGSVRGPKWVRFGEAGACAVPKKAPRAPEMDRATDAAPENARALAGRTRRARATQHTLSLTRNCRHSRPQSPSS